MAELRIFVEKNYCIFFVLFGGGWFELIIF